MSVQRVLVVLTLATCALASSLAHVVNPNCALPGTNATGMYTLDEDFPCILASECLAADGSYTNVTAQGEVSCDNWLCSLRVNCGCYAGRITKCDASEVIQTKYLVEPTPTSKPGCDLVARMFQDVGCKMEDYIGPRDPKSRFKRYLDDCLLEC